MLASTIRIPVSAIRPVSAAPLTVPGLEGEAVAILVDLLAQAKGPALDDSIAWLTAQLRQQAANLSNTQVSTLMRLIVALDRRREEAELAADPARRAGIEQVGEHFARKAQSGFSATPLPEPSADHQSETKPA